MPGQREGPGAALRHLRKRAGMSLQEVADAAETSTAYLSKVERDIFPPSDEYVAKVMTALGRRLAGAA